MDFAKKFRYSANSLISIFLVFVIIFGINIFAKNNFSRIDLTENGNYTISNSTISTLEDLDDLVTIKVYFSEELPPHFVSVKQDINDVLNEYQAYADGNIRIRYIDPNSDEEFLNEVKSLGIPEVKMNIVGKDKLEVQSGYLGMGIFYEDNNEIIPVIQNTGNLEYQLTSAIAKVTREEAKTIGFLEAHGEHGAFDANPYATENTQQPDYTLLRRELEKNYNVRGVNLQQDQNSLSEIDTLIVAGPKESIDQYELFLIDQFILAGNNVVFLVDTVHIQPGLIASKIETGLNDFLGHFGIKIIQDVVYDQQSHASANFTQGIFNFAIPYPFWVKSSGENLSQNNPIVAFLESLIFTWASPLQIEPKDGIESEILAYTTEQSGITNGAFRFDPNQQIQNDNPKKYPMAALQRGSFTSFFKDKDIPSKEIPAQNQEEQPTIEPLNFDLANRIDSAELSSSILVIGDSDSFTDRTLQNFPQNAVFIQNAIDAITLDRSLIDVRAKLLTQRPLEETTDGQKSFIKWFGILFTPSIVIIYGFMRMHMRNRKRKFAQQITS
jgi:gliding-associated putative ABC transporter substrate-binding component GldG